MIVLYRAMLVYRHAPVAHFVCCSCIHELFVTLLILLRKWKCTSVSASEIFFTVFYCGGGDKKCFRHSSFGIHGELYFSRSRYVQAAVLHRRGIVEPISKRFQGVSSVSFHGPILFAPHVVAGCWRDFPSVQIRAPWLFFVLRVQVLAFWAFCT